MLVIFHITFFFSKALLSKVFVACELPIIFKAHYYATTIDES